MGPVDDFARLPQPATADTDVCPRLRSCIANGSRQRCLVNRFVSFVFICAFAFSMNWDRLHAVPVNSEVLDNAKLLSSLQLY